MATKTTWVAHTKRGELDTDDRNELPNTIIRD